MRRSIMCISLRVGYLLSASAVYCLAADTHEPIHGETVPPITAIATSFERVGSPHHHESRSRLAALRSEITQEWANDLSRGAARCYTLSKACDTIGQVSMFGSAILSCSGAALNNQYLVICSTVLAVGSVAIHRFGRYASNESSSRMAALNRMFVQEGVAPSVVIGDGSSSGSNNE